jgi:sporulation protein YlmC with PRC-barrel domain
VAMTTNETRTGNFRKTMSAGTLIGDKVTNAQNDNLGDLKEIMLDVDTGRVGYGVLETGAFLGMAGKYLAVPWQAFGIDERNHKLVLNVPKETLQNAEGFDKNDWPDTTNPDFGRRIHQHYGYAPYWEV